MPEKTIDLKSVQQEVQLILKAIKKFSNIDEKTMLVIEELKKHPREKQLELLHGMVFQKTQSHPQSPIIIATPNRAHELEKWSLDKSLVFMGCILKELKIEHKFRMAKYLLRINHWSDMYIIVPKSKSVRDGYYTLHPLLPFNVEPLAIKTTIINF